MKVLVLIAALCPVSAALSQVSGLRTEKLADGVYAMIRTIDPGGASDANSLVIINEHDVIVVDANITTSSSRLVIDGIRRLTPNPVRYVIATHAHSDHIYGNQAYREAWPGVDFIAHHTVRDDVINDDIPSFERNLHTEY